MRNNGFVFTFPKPSQTTKVIVDSVPVEAQRIGKPNQYVPTLHDLDGTPQLSKLRRLAQRMDEFDAYTRGHLERLQHLSATVAQAFGLREAEVTQIRVAALLHDIGKIMIPASILRREGPLSEDEWRLMRQHTIHGARITAAHGLEPQIVEMVRSHHERWDGRGYPDHLSGDAIPLGARIIGAVDAYDAMTTKRSYRNALSREEAISRLEKDAGTHFDPRVVPVLISVVNSTAQSTLKVAVAATTKSTVRL
jgi:putative nucleotidyltransferase with HDIG domain